MSSKDADEFPNAFARKLFFITLIGCGLYIAVVSIFIL